MPVYPRWRGGHLKPVGSLFFFGGLSPLARGTRSGEAGKRG
ncbi:hypothetical protein AC64_3081 [Escherichia coli 6-537-08_S3_C3]|nr:hypothetical protein AC64_3081 [Escherichia coli 6-537-08_S3_C3]